MNRVVITGMGIYSSIGKTLEEVRDSLYQGKSGIGLDAERKRLGFRSSLTGILERPALKGLLSRRMRVGMSEEAEYAYMASLDAFKQAGIDDDFLDKRDVGILYGNDSSARAVSEGMDLIHEKLDTALIGSGNIFQSMNSSISMNLSVIFRLKGMNLTVSGACASGSHAIGLGFLLIRQGLQDCILCGGGQEVNYHATASFDGLSAFSVSEENPEAACRPFDRDRDGLVPSGGAASIVLESYDSATKRGAPIIAEVTGYGFSSNGEHISVPNVKGPVKAMEMALKDAKVNPESIPYVNAHATATPVGDINEAKAILQVFGNNQPLVSSTKSMTGHEMWMAGASEVIYSVLMMQNEFIAPNINFENLDPQAEGLKVVNKTKNKKFDVFLSNSFGFGGTNSALVVKKYK